MQELKVTLRAMLLDSSIGFPKYHLQIQISSIHFFFCCASALDQQMCSQEVSKYCLFKVFTPTNSPLRTSSHSARLLFHSRINAKWEHFISFANKCLIYYSALLGYLSQHQHQSRRNTHTYTPSNRTNTLTHTN